MTALGLQSENLTRLKPIYWLWDHLQALPLPGGFPGGASGKEPDYAQDSGVIPGLG